MLVGNELETLGQTIRRIRIARGWSIRDFSAQIAAARGTHEGPSPGHLHKIEEYDTLPSVELFACMAEAFGMSLDELWYGEGGET